MIYYTAFIFFIHTAQIYTEILYIDNEPLNDHKVTGTTTTEKLDDDSPLPLSSLFAQSNRYKCLVQGGCHGNNEIPKNYFGPRFQKVHLALPRRDLKEVGYKETIRFNERIMTLKTLSQRPHIFEVSNFLSDNETELIIDLAKEKGMKKPPSRQPFVYLPDKINHNLFDSWDEDFDGHLSIEEICGITELNPLLLSEENVREILNTTELDKDDNEYISYGELSKGGLKRFKNGLLSREKARSKRKTHATTEQWLWHDDDELLMYEGLLEDYHERIKAITGIPTELIEQSEPVQVTNNSVGSFSHCQQDSSTTEEGKECCVYGGIDCRMCRYITIFMFLNDVEEGGELVFPLADNQTFSYLSLKTDTIRKCETMPNKTLSNLVITPQRGKAVIWYNHGVSPHTGWMSQMEPQSLSASTLVTKGNRWIAKMWIDIVGDGVNELRPWKMGADWLSDNNKQRNVVEEMRNDDFREGEPYIHFYKENYKRAEKPPNTKLSPDNLEKAIGTSKGTFIKPVILPEKSVVKDTKPKVTLDQLKQSNTEEHTLRPLQPEESKTNSKNGRLPNNNENAEMGDVTIETNDAAIETNDATIKIIDLTKMDKPIKPAIPSDTLEMHLKRDEVPLGPPKRPVDPEPFLGGKLIENRLVKASLLLLEELDREELEIIARSLHDKLQLACIPLIVNPLGF